MRKPDRAPFGYRDATGARHQVLVRHGTEGAWQVLDVVVVETLTGVGDGRDAAEAIARDYVAEHHHPTAGSRRRANRSAA